MSVVFGLSFLVAYGVATHWEPGLLRVCWTGAGGLEARYEDADSVDGQIANASCDRPEELVWPQSQVPLTVSAVEGNETVLIVGSTRRRAIDAATDDINRQLGFRMLRPVTSVVPASVVVQVGAAMGVSSRTGAGASPLGYARHYRGDRDSRLHCRGTVLSRVSDISTQYVVVLHELLHCVGLAHDWSESSVMYPFTRDDIMGHELRFVLISDRDRRRLAKLYNRPRND